MICINSLDLLGNLSIHHRMEREPYIECTAARGLLNLALIAAEDAAGIAAFSPDDEAGADISQLIELGYRIAILGEAIETMRSLRS